MSQAKKKRVWQRYAVTLFAVLIGVAFGYVTVTYTERLGVDTPLYQKLLSLGGLFIGTYVAFLLHLIVHEAGHLVFGLLTGYKFGSFRVFSFMWLRENGELKLKRLSLLGTGGQCLMVPPNMKNGKIPLVLYNLGGSLMNGIVSALFLVGYFLCSDVLFLSTLLLILAIVGGAFALMNGVPMRGIVDNDGYNALASSENADAVRAFWVQLKVAEQNSIGVRLKDMPSDWFAMPSDEAMKNSMVATLGVFACNRLMDAESFEEADERMAHLLRIDSGMVDLYRCLLICDRLYVELIGENRREVIRCMLTEEQKKIMSAMKRYPSVLRTEYALALLFEKNMVKAEVKRNEFEKMAKFYPYPHEIESERDLMRLAQRRSVGANET